MAKTSSETPAAGGDPAKLKREIRVLVKAILEEDENNNSNSNNAIDDAIDRAKELLSDLKDLKNAKKTTSFTRDTSFSCPPEFRCPLSKQLMRDPVIVSTGQTYDKPYIQKWLKAGERTCPLTQQVLSHTILTPNYLIKDMICKWCKIRGIEIPDPIGGLNEEDEVDEVDRDHFLSLLNKMSKSIHEQKAAAKELRLLTKRKPCFRGLFGESSETITLLLKPMIERRGLSWSNNNEMIDENLQEDLITILLNISIHDSNKKLVGETPMVIPLLIDALKCGTPETRSNSAAALFTLSALDSNKVLIGKSGALKPLIDLLDEGHPLAMKDAASAIFNLCIVQENRARAVREGGVGVILKKIKNEVQVDELLAILAMLSTHQRAVEEMSELGVVPCLVSIIRGSSCARNKENCIAILYTICINNRAKLRELREEERAYGTLSLLAQEGTSRAKRKANSILERLNRAHNLTHTA